MKHIFLLLFLSCSLCCIGQSEDNEIKEIPPRPPKKSEFALSYTGRSQNLGLGIVMGSNHFTRYNMVIGGSFEIYYRQFNNSGAGVKVRNVSALLPLTLGYKFVIDPVFIIPYGGLFAGGAWQSQLFNDGTSKNVFIADWGYVAGIKAGVDVGRVWPFIRVAYYSNFDANNTDGHFFRAVPISIGIMYPTFAQRRKHHR